MIMVVMQTQMMVMMYADEGELWLVAGDKEKDDDDNDDAW